MEERQFQIRQIEAANFAKEGISMDEQKHVAVRVDLEQLTEAIANGALRAIASQPTTQGDALFDWIIRYGGMLERRISQGPSQTVGEGQAIRTE